MLVKAPTLSALWHGACSHIFFGDRDQISWQGSMSMAYDNFLHANSMEYEMDVGRDLWLTKARFPKLQRDYLDLDEYNQFLERCANIAKRRGSITQMTCKVHGARGKNSFKPTGNYAHGNCMIGFTFRMHMKKDGGQPVLGLHSRVSYVSYMGALDLALAYVMVKEIGDALGFAPEECAFQWYVDSLQWANMQSMAYMCSRPKMMKALRQHKTYPSTRYPTINIMRRTEENFRTKYEEGFTPKEEKYAQMMRYRTRYERSIHGVEPGLMPSIPVQTLTLDALRNPPRARKPKEEDDGTED